MKRAWKAVLAGLFVAAIAMPAMAADLGPEDFESFAPASPLVGQGGWTYTGGSSYDVGINEDLGGNQAVRISNGTMSGSFGDWLFSPAIDPAQELGNNQEFVAEFDLLSMKPNELQENLQISVAPQTGGGARMSFLKFEDTDAGIVVSFADVMNLPEEFPAGESWRTVQIGQPLDRSQTHHVKLVMNLLEGPHNDVVQVYIDGSAGLVPGRTGAATFDGFFAPVDNQPTINKAKAGQTIPMKWTLSAPSFATSWEDYYRYNPESNAAPVQDPNIPGTELLPQPWGTRKVDSLIFQARCSAVGPCANAPVQGQGFLIDNVEYTSSPIGTPLPVATQGVSDASAYGTPVFTTTGSAAAECSPAGEDLDAIETYTSNAGGLLYHGNGVWQYNWQTPKSYAGKCVEMTLNLTGDSTLFKFVK